MISISGGNVRIQRLSQDTAFVVLLLAGTLFLGLIANDKLVSKRAVLLESGTTTWKIRTGCPDVGSLLAERGIRLGDGDSVDPAESTELTEGMKIRLETADTAIVAETTPIPARSTSLQTAALPRGRRVVSLPGRDGLAVRYVRVRSRDGRELSRETLGVATAVGPVPERVLIGTGDPAPPRGTAVRPASPDDSTPRVPSLDLAGTFRPDAAERSLAVLGLRLLRVSSDLVPAGRMVEIAGVGRAIAMASDDARGVEAGSACRISEVPGRTEKLPKGPVAFRLIN